MDIVGSQGNTLIAHPATLENMRGLIKFTGTGATVKIGRGVTSAAAHITIGEKASLEIGERCSLSKIEIFCARYSEVKIGKGCGFTWHTRIYCHEPAAIHLGDECLIASGTLFTCSDMHSIVDVTTGLRINPAASVRRGNRVWVAAESRVLKGGEIGDGSVLGMRSTLTGKIGENSLAVGTPAKVIRTGITWCRDLI